MRKRWIIAAVIVGLIMLWGLYNKYFGSGQRFPEDTIGDRPPVTEQEAIDRVNKVFRKLGGAGADLRRRAEAERTRTQ